MVSNAKIFVTLFLAVFATTMGVGIVIPLLPIYAHELGAGAFQIGLVFGAFSLSRSIFVPYFGKLSDRKGKKPFLTLGLFIYCLLSLLFLFSTNVQALILIRLGQGFASAMILPVAQAYVGSITPKNREGLTMSLFNISLFGGLSIGPTLGGLVKDLLSIQFSFLSMAALVLFGFFLCLLLLPAEKGFENGQAPDSQEPIHYLQLMQVPAILSLFAFRMCLTTGTGIMWAFVPLLASTRLKLTSSAIGVIITINVLIGGVFQAPMGYVADRVSKRFLITTGGLLGAVSIFYLNVASSFGELFFASALLGLAGGISLPAIMALGVVEGRRTDAMGSIMGLLALSHSLGMLLGPLLAGILLDLTSFTAIFVLGTIIVAAGTLILFTLQRPNSGQNDIRT